MTRLCRSLLALGIALLAACDKGGPVQISASGFGAFEPSLAAIDGGYAVAWNDNRHGNDEIYLRLLDDELTPRTEEHRLTHSPELSFEAALTSFDGKLAIAWYERDPAGHLAVQLGLWSLDGTALWSKPISSPAFSGRVPVLQAQADRLFIAWVEDAAEAEAASTLWGAAVDAQGNWLRRPFAIAPASRNTWNLNAAALQDGQVAVVFDAETETRASELYLARIDVERVAVTRLSADDGHASKYPDIAVHEALGALTWFDVKDGNEEVYVTLMDPLAPPTEGIEGIARRVTQTAGDSIGAYLAWNRGTLGLAWNDNSAGQHEIFFQAFDTTGAPLEDARQLTHTDTQSLIPSIVAHGDGFALAWDEVTYGGGGHDGESGATRSEITVIAVKSRTANSL